MSKSVATTDSKELTRFQVETIGRKLAYADQRGAASKVSLLSFPVKPCKASPDGFKSPSAKGLIVHFNKLTKDTLGYSCDEIDKIEDVFLTGVIASLRYESEAVMREYEQTWNGTKEHYEEMKAVLWTLPISAKQAYDNKMANMAKAKGARK